MNGITALGVYLLLLFSLLALALFLSLLCLAGWRRRFRLTESASETSTEPYKSPSKELIYYLCWKNQARIGPAGTALAPGTGSPAKPRDDAEEEFDKLYNRSRVLYTIKEEEKETETEVEEEEGRSVEGGSSIEIELVEEDIEIDPQNFYSPLSSPQFYTPCSSPSRAGAATSPEREAAAAAQASEPPEFLV